MKKKSTKNHPVYCFAGEDEIEIRKHINQIEEKLFNNESDKELNSLSFFADETSIAEVLSNCNTYTMFAEQKLVRVFNFEKFGSKDKESLLDYVKSPSNNTILILISYAYAKESELSSAFRNAINKNGQFIFFKRKYQNNMMELIQRKLRSAGYFFNFDFVNYLSQYIDNTEGEVDKVVQTISENFKEDKKLTIEKVSDIVNLTKIPTVFDFLDNLFTRNIFDAIKTFRQIIEENESALFMLIGQIHSQLRVIWMVKTFRESGMRQDEIAKKLGKHPFIIKKTIENQINNFSFGLLEKIFDELFYLEYFFKSHDVKLHKIRFEIFLQKLSK